MKLASLLALVPAVLLLPGFAGAEERRFSFRYHTEIGPIPPGAGPVHIFIPIPVENGKQLAASLEIDASIPGAIETEPVYGNRFWHGQLAESDGEPITVTLTSEVVRRPVSGGSVDEPSPLEEAESTRFLGPNRRVVVADEMLDPILREIRAKVAGGGRAETARAIYDWVVDNVTYKRVGTGWGNGDTFWACSERYGNCTDFHALFISLARTEGIPAKFEMGFPVPDDRPEGAVDGYHCWVEFHLTESGWTPIDASEASKHPERREALYASQPADRIHFSTGRDLRLGPDHRGEPLNYFIYPHVEVNGAPWTGALERDFRFQERPGATGTVRAVEEQHPVTEGETSG
jgi:transglutaminase-like putative cysteine protease